MLIDELIDETLLVEMINQKYVRVQSHPTEALCIYNYTEHAQFDRVWNDATRQCRGLIIDIVTGEIVARPFPKFFNHGEPGAAVLDPDTPAHISNKMDGSLGILYPVRGGWAIATRGSFASEQAIHGTRTLARYSFIPQQGVTLLFEIIYPENRIVLDYRDMDDLVLLAGVDIETGTIFSPDMIHGWIGPVVDVMSAATLREALALPPRENSEGVVVRVYRDMVKLKQADYIALHRIITNTSARVIWEHLAVNACKGLIKKPKDWSTLLHLDPQRAQQILEAGPDWQEKMLHGVPDEFFGWFRETILTLEDAVWDFKSDMIIYFSDLKAQHGDDRKAFAQAVKEYRYAGLMFHLLDDRDITPNLWLEVYPAAERPWGQRSEDVS